MQCGNSLCMSMKVFHVISDGVHASCPISFKISFSVKSSPSNIFKLPEILLQGPTCSSRGLPPSRVSSSRISAWQCVGLWILVRHWCIFMACHIPSSTATSSRWTCFSRGVWRSLGRFGWFMMIQMIHVCTSGCHSMFGLCTPLGVVFGVAYLEWKQNGRVDG